MACYENSNLNELKEFYRYLNKCRRVEKSAKGMINIFSMPLYTAFITIALTSIKSEDMINTSQKIIDNMVNYGWDAEKIITVFVLICIFIGSFILFLMIVPMFIMVKSMFKTTISEGETENFYKDYMENIKDVIVQKELMITKEIHFQN